MADRSPPVHLAPWGRSGSAPGTGLSGAARGIRKTLLNYGGRAGVLPRSQYDIIL
jgi:hypothetical protein